MAKQERYQKRSLCRLCGLAVSWALVAGLFPSVSALPGPVALAADPPPKRTIADPNANFSGIWVDTTNNEFFVSDDGHHSILVFARTAADPVDPLRRIQGNKTLIDFNPNVVVDVANNEVWTSMNDTAEKATVYARTANGDVDPLRIIDFKAKLVSSTRSWGWSVDAKNNEVGATMQRNPAVIAIFNRVTGDLKREIKGDKTKLNDPHGFFIDNVNDELFVTNEGHKLGLPPDPPSVTVYGRIQKGNVAPKRTVQGPKTGLALPKHIHVDTANNEFAVANAHDNSVRVFARLANGDTAPLRVIQGADTKLNDPVGVFVDAVNNEIFVTNWRTHQVTVYARTANGNVPPKRTVTAKPGGAQVGIGNPGAIALDLANNEIWATNCVSHPRLAVWNRLDDGQIAPKRVIIGSATRISRSNHGVAVDTANNEVFTMSAQENAVLVFNRLDAGNVAPKRVIQGPLAEIESGSKGIDVDTKNNEIMFPAGRDPGTGLHKVLTFDRVANGNVAPKRKFMCECFGGESPVGIVIDNVNNEVFVIEGGATPKVLVFDRLATGTVDPKREISGTSTKLDHPRQIALDLKNNEIVVANLGDRAVNPPVQGSITVYNRTDSGNVAPKRFIQGPISGVGHPRSVYVDNVNDEIGSADSKENWIRIFPRVF